MHETHAIKKITRFNVRNYFKQQHQIQLVIVLSAFIAWETLAALSLNPVFPSSFSIFREVALFFSRLDSYVHVRVTLIEIVMGFTIGAIVGVALGVVFGSVRFLGRALEPYLSAFTSTPKIVFLPIALAIFGSGIGSKVALAAVGAFFPVVLGTYAAMLGVRSVHIMVGRVFSLTPIQMASKIYIPSIARPVLIAMRLGLGISVTSTLLAEVKMSKAGLGNLIIEHYNHFRIEQMYASLLVALGLFAVANYGMNIIIWRATGNKAVKAGNRGLSSSE